MAPQQLPADSLAEVKGHLKEHSGNKNKSIVILFSGEIGVDGKSWCPDCVEAEPVVEAAVTNAGDNIIFILCSVGLKEQWKDPKNEFRTDTEFSLTCIPTLVRMESKGDKHVITRKLQEAECAKADLVQMFFEED